MRRSRRGLREGTMTASAVLTDAMKDKAMRDAQRLRVRQLAAEAGLVVVQESTRRFLVIQIESRGGNCRSDGCGGYCTALSGKIVCRGTHTDVWDHIAQCGARVPLEDLPI